MLLDSSAVLAYLNQEPGWEIVEDAILHSEACMSTVNASEVLSKLNDWGMAAPLAKQTLHKLPLRILPFTVEQAQESAAIRTATKLHGLSLGDRACLAVALTEKLPVLTGDRIWLTLAESLSVKVLTFRPGSH